MEKTKCAAILIITASTVVAGIQLACCPQFTYLIAQSEEKYECWQPITNGTMPIRLECNTTNINIKGATVEDGNVVLEDPFHDKITVNSTLVCINNISTIKDAKVTSLSRIALICQNDDDEYDSALIRDHFYIEDVVLGYCMTASVFFLIMIVIIYSSFHDLRDNFGKSIINYCGSLAAGLFLMSIMKFVSYGGENYCALRGFSTYFFLLAAFFWTNSLSIQAMRETRRITLPDYKWCSYKWYLLYSWGMPALLTVIMVMVNYIPGDHERPGIGLKFCWFSNLKQQWYYMYSVMTVIMVINVVIFFMTLRVFRFQKRRGCYLTCNILQGVKFKIAVAAKLFFVLGLPWMFEMICASMEAHIVWSLISIFNSSQGIVLFLILVVCRKRAIRLMSESGWLCCCRGLANWYIGPTMSAQDQVLMETTTVGT